MRRGNSLTISACSGRKLSLRACARRARGGLAAAACLLLAACAIEVGPPPESDLPLVPEAAEAPPPPPQPSEPQAWSRDLDFDSEPAAANRGELVEGLVADDVQAQYSGQRLTHESALNPEKPLSEAEQARQRAQQRAAAAGMPAPPQVTAAPVTEVEAQALPDAGGAAAAPVPRRESRLPPPPTFPPPDAGEAEPAATAAAPENAAPAPAETAATAFAPEAWDPPMGTILVQVSAVPDGGKATQEWERLQALYPQVLRPLRLVVEEARLGERGVFYRVQAGAFGTQAGAAAACDSLISQGQACFVVVR